MALIVMGGRQPEPQPPLGRESSFPAPDPDVSDRKPAVIGQVKPFHWSQMESSDYRTYVANLKSIGCPEQTIRDIITADVSTLYAFRRAALERAVAQGSFAARKAIERELQDLRKQEACVIASLLGMPAGAVERTPPGPADASPGSLRQSRLGEVCMPLVFQEIGPSDLQFSAEHLRVVNDLRQRFIDEVGANQNPNDPVYLERWQRSQPEVDADLRGMIGVGAWQVYQVAARARREEQTPSGR